MKVVILAGGMGTRITEETTNIPKPMVEIGGKPIIWHIMKIYSSYGFNDFVICLGYKGYILKEYFSHYFLHTTDVTIDLRTNGLEVHNSTSEPWRITLVDTGVDTMTGSRLRQVKRFLDDEPFMMTYGDGVADVDVRRLVEKHKISGKSATLTTVQAAGRFGVLDIDNKDNVQSFLEKPKGEGSWINAGFFVLEPGIFDYIKPGKNIVWEQAPLEHLARDGNLSVYKHKGFWKCMDTLRDKIELEHLWRDNKALWKVWED